MQQVLKKEAWKYLSENLKWTESLLEKYAEKVDWKEISYNDNIYWTIPMLKKFSRKLDWSVLSNHADRMWFTYEHLETFKDRWDWKELSGNSDLPIETIRKMADYIDWKALIDCRYRDDIFSMEFLKEFEERIPASSFKDSGLWRKIVEDKVDKLRAEIVLK